MEFRLNLTMCSFLTNIQKRRCSYCKNAILCKVCLSGTRGFTWYLKWKRTFRSFLDKNQMKKGNMPFIKGHHMCFKLYSVTWSFPKVFKFCLKSHLSFFFYKNTKTESWRRKVISFKNWSSGTLGFPVILSEISPSYCWIKNQLKNSVL